MEVVPTVDAAHVLESLRDVGLRITGPRREVVEAICAREMPFSADEVYDELRAAGSSTGRATVFRTLDLLVGLRGDLDTRPAAAAFLGDEADPGPVSLGPHLSRISLGKLAGVELGDQFRPARRLTGGFGSGAGLGGQFRCRGGRGLVHGPAGGAQREQDSGSNCG